MYENVHVNLGKHNVTNGRPDKSIYGRRSKQTKQKTEIMEEFKNKNLKPKTQILQIFVVSAPEMCHL